MEERAAGNESLAIVMFDPEGRGGSGAYHWVAYGIDPALGGFAENEINKPSPKFTGGKSTQDLAYYMGPCAGPNTGWHHYTYTAIASDYEPGALPAGLTGPELLQRMAGGRGQGASSIVLRWAVPESTPPDAACPRHYSRVQPKLLAVEALICPRISPPGDRSVCTFT